MAAKPVCFICLQNFTQGSARRGSKNNDNLNQNFIDFLQQHLQIPPSNLELLLRCSSETTAPPLQLFCDGCKVIISGICKFYQDLLEVQNKLRVKLGKLEEIIGDSFGEKAENSLASWVASQLKGSQKKTGNRQVLELRILLSHYCKLECSKHVITPEKEQGNPNKKTDTPPKAPTRVTRQVAKSLPARPSSSPPPSPITTENNVIVKEELPDRLETEQDQDSNYFGDETGSSKDYHQHSHNSDYSSDGDGTDNNGNQDNDWIESNDDKEQDDNDKPSSEDDEDDFDEDSDSDDDWNTSSKKKSPSGRGRPTRNSTTTRKTQAQPSTSKKSDRKSHRRLVADKLNLYPDTVWKCDYCTSTLKSGNSLFTHLTYKHDRSISTRTFSCYLCSRSFGFAQTRDIHLKLYHWKEQPLTFTCTPSSSPDTPKPPCGAPSFDNPSSLLTHLQTEHSSQHIYLCTTCQWPFLSANTRLLHELLHTQLPPGGLGYPCPMSGCTHHAGHVKHLVRHYSSKHDINEDSFRCKICHKGFSNQATLNSHQRLHTIQEKQAAGTLPKDFNCEKCGKWHGNAKSLEMHINRKHTLQKCPDCGVEKYYDAYRTHLRVKHGKGRGRSHVCEKCGKECRNKYVLRKHMEMKHHPEGKNRMGEWVCSECGKSYHGRVALQVHSTMKHMAEEERDKLPVELGKGRWKSKCLKCEKIFKSGSDVLAHFYFMQKSCIRNQEKLKEKVGEGNGEGEGEGKEGDKKAELEEMEEMKEWFGGQEGDGNGQDASFSQE